MDPTQAIIAPWMQYGVLGSVVIGLGVITVALWRALDKRTEAHMAAVERCHQQNLETNLKYAEACNRLSNSMVGLEQVVKAALDVVKAR